jgi:predicted nucleic acid-binding protein
MNAILIDTNIYSHAMRGDSEIIEALQLRRLGMLFMPNVSKLQYIEGFRVCSLLYDHRMLGNEKLLPNLQDSFEIRLNRIISRWLIDGHNSPPQATS